MEIIRRRNVASQISVYGLTSGEAFRLEVGNDIYMKVNNTASSAVNLENGDIINFEPLLIVYRVNAQVVVED